MPLKVDCILYTGAIYTLVFTVIVSVASMLQMHCGVLLGYA